MEEVDLESAEFWEGDAPLVLSNPALDPPPMALREVLVRREELKRHVVFRTSGSEGEAKFVALSKQALLCSAEAINRHLQADRTDRWLRALPCFHVGGFGIHARAYLAAGGPDAVQVMDGKWNPGKFAETCGREKITLTSLVPRQVTDVVEAELRAPDSMRAVIVGGGALPDTAGQRARELGWPLLQSYGMTEAGSQVATQGLESLEEDFGNARLPILDHWEVRLNAEGILELKGDALLSAYLEAGSEGGDGLMVIDPKVEGWFRTGDRVRLEEKTGPRLSFVAREGEMVKILGELVSLRDLRRRLEDAIEPSLCGEVALAGVPDDRLGVRLVLVHSEAITGDLAEEVGEVVNAGLPGYARIVERRGIGGIPRTVLGKVDYGVIRGKIRGIGGVPFSGESGKSAQK